MSRVIVHVDMDAFFVSVELLRRPDLQGRPVVVATGTDPSARGVVMAASYEARRFGVHSALPLATAHRRCPQMVLVPRDMTRYRDVSRGVMEVLRRYSDAVEVAGLDEAYLDLADSPAPKARARRLKAEMLEETGLVCSVGIGPNKLVAKIASDLDKPDGFCVLNSEMMLEAVGDRPASLIPGVGPKTYERLQRGGIRTVAELAAAEPAVLQAALGRGGLDLRQRGRGIDERPLETSRRRKSESRETTFATDVSDAATLRETLERLSRDVCNGLAREDISGRTVTVKLRLAPFRTRTRSQTLPQATRDPGSVSAIACELLDRFELDSPVRLVGVGISSLEREAGSPAEESPAELALPI
ncbi:MAG: DNA polymerase IV [Actinomycetota bacterium]|nr:DNA polymerase IV [Actinomycetota bacterium]